MAKRERGARKRAMHRNAGVPTDAPGLCGCGCGEPVAKGRFFRQGHDARHKGNLKRAAVGGSKAARAELRKRGWLKLVNLEVA